MKYVQLNWKFGFSWLLATIVGLAVGMGAMFAGVGVAINNAPMMLFGAVIGAVMPDNPTIA